MTLKLIRLNDLNVHVRYSDKAENFTFNQARYTKNDRNKNAATRVDITLWIKNSTYYVAFDTKEVIHTLKKSEYKHKRSSIKQSANGYKADGINIESCVLVVKSGTRLWSKKHINGFDNLIKIALKHTSVKGKNNLFENPDLVEFPDNKNPTNTKLYEIKGAVYSGSQSTDDSIDEDYHIKMQQENAAEEKINATSDISETEKEQITLARHGQGRFRNAVLKLYGFRCVLTGIETNSTLIASHIMPWGHCNTAEQRLSPHNGLLLAATYDKLFDQGLITFDENGELLISHLLPDADKEKLFRENDVRRQLFNPSPKTLQYLQYHREMHRANFDDK